MGLFLGMLAFAMAYYFYGEEKLFNYHFLKAEKSKAPLPIPKAVVEKRRLSPDHNKQAAAQRFEFYQLLPGLEVPLPDPSESTTTFARPNTTPQTTSNKLSTHTTLPPKAPVYTKQAAPRYMIQAGAYRHREGAEHLKNRIMGLGFKAKHQAVEAEDGTWFRVIVGPFANEALALEQKKRLQNYQIRGILILQR